MNWTRVKKGAGTTLIVAAIIGILVGGAASAVAMRANADTISETEAQAAAVDFMKAEGILGETENVYWKDTEKEVVLHAGGNWCYLEYEMEYLSAGGKKIVLLVNAKNGAVRVEDMDFRR